MHLLHNIEILQLMFIDNELVLLYDFSAAELLDIETIEQKARNKFLDTKEFFE